MKAGVACLDVTPPLGLAMAGFAARTAPAQAVHDALTVRALVVDDTALLVADVIGLDAASCARIRAGSPIPKIVVAATHTHGGPAVMPDRLSPDVDPAYLASLEAACVQAVCEAAATALPCRLVAGTGANPGIARNRRHAGGIVDPSLPVLRLDRADGSPLAVLVAYACHPTVLGPDNLAWTGDYPHVVRGAIEDALPGATCIFLTGCAGDANVGHAATASYSAVSAPGRTFAEAERIGRRIAACALAAELSRAQGPTGFATAEVTLDLVVRDTGPPQAMAERWRQQVLAEPDKTALLAAWIRWSETAALSSRRSWTTRVSLLCWAGRLLVALPGEPFARTSLALRQRLGAAFVFAYADDCPGYFPAEDEYAVGGYEVDDAHRYYGMSAPFSPGSAERLENVAARLTVRL
jgi:neutral ceramidase